MTRVGLLGCAHLHAGAYAEALRGGDLGGRAVAVFDFDAARAASFAAAHELRVAGTPDELCRDVDAVIVVSEHRRYVSMVAAAAEAGRPVLCEKPLGATVEDYRLLCSSTAWLSVGFPVRYSQPVVAAKKLVDGGCLGALVAMSGVNHGAFPGGFFGNKELAGGGAIIDHVVHLADTLRYLTRCEYATAYAEAGSFRAVGDVEDCAQVIATTTEGAWVSIDPSWSRPQGMPGANDFLMTMWFERGVLRVDAFARRATVVSAEGRFVHEGYGEGMNELMLRDWLRAVAHEAPPPVPAVDGAKATALALAAQRSAETGEVVELASIEASIEL